MSVRVRLPNPLAALDDRALLNRFVEMHDQPAFEQLVKRHGRFVFGVCRRAVRDAHLAEDAFQAVFLVLAKNPRGAAEATSVGGWLFGIARRVGLAARRHERRREKHTRRAGGVGPLMADQGTSHPSDFTDLLRVLDDELAALPDELRGALVACFLEERTQDDAARELGWSLSTLRRRLDRGKELLRARLSRRGVTLGVGLLAGALAPPARAAVPALAPSPASAALAAEALARGIGAKLLAACAAVALAVGGVTLAFAPSNDAPPLPVRAEKPKPEAAPTPRAVVAKPWASVSGRVVFPTGRDLPEPKLVDLGRMKGADEWKPFLPLRYEDVVVDADTRGIANVVVWLRPDSDDKKAAFTAEKVSPDLATAKPQDRTVLAVRGQFVPRVLAVRAGDRVTFDNRLPVPTNVHYTTTQFDGESREFNVLVGKGMAHTSKSLPALRTPDAYQSNIYPWMRGYVWAFDHPYFAVTDERGRFEIAGAPAGAWRLVVWHEAVGYRGGAPGRLGSKLTIPATRDGKVELDPLPFDDWPKP